MYKRSVAVGLSALVLITSASVADAATKKKPALKPTKRTVSWNYTAIHGLTVSPVGGSQFENPCAVNTDGCFDLPTQKYETGVSFKAVDDHGLPVAVQWYFDGAYTSGNVFTACGSATFPVSKGTFVQLATVVDPTCQGIPTQGKVTFTVVGKK